MIELRFRDNKKEKSHLIILLLAICNRYPRILWIIIFQHIFCTRVFKASNWLHDSSLFITHSAIYNHIFFLQRSLKSLNGKIRDKERISVLYFLLYLSKVLSPLHQLYHRYVKNVTFWSKHNEPLLCRQWKKKKKEEKKEEKEGGGGLEYKTHCKLFGIFFF